MENPPHENDGSDEEASGSHHSSGLPSEEEARRAQAEHRARDRRQRMDDDDDSDSSEEEEFDDDDVDDESLAVRQVLVLLQPLQAIADAGEPHQEGAVDVEELREFINDQRLLAGLPIRYYGEQGQGQPQEIRDFPQDFAARELLGGEMDPEFLRHVDVPTVMRRIQTINDNEDLNDSEDDDDDDDDDGQDVQDEAEWLERDDDDYWEDLELQQAIARREAGYPLVVRFSRDGLGYDVDAYELHSVREDDDDGHPVFCDECGANPVTGIRYKSRVQSNYDICQECLLENHNNDPSLFVAFTDPAIDEEQVMAEAGVNMNELRDGRGFTAESIAELINHPLFQNPHSALDDITLCLTPDTPESTPDDRETLTRLLASHKTLKEMELVVYSDNSDMEEAIVALARGLQQSTSVKSVAWTIEYHTVLSKSTCDAIQSLIENTQSIQSMFFFREHDVRILCVPNSPKVYEHPDKYLVNAVFDGLLTTRIETIRWKNRIFVHDLNKKKAWKAMKDNPHLKRIKTKFYDEDYMLELLRLDKKHQWMSQWMTRPDCSVGSQDDNGKNSADDCWAVLAEAQTASECDPAFVVYHFLRNRPEVLVYAE